MEKKNINNVKMGKDVKIFDFVNVKCLPLVSHAASMWSC